MNYIKEKKTALRGDIFEIHEKSQKKIFTISNCIFLCESDGGPSNFDDFLHHPVPVLDLRLQLAVDAL